MKISFDVISDLYLNNDQDFSWEGRATSLYCIVAGNISDDISTVKKVLGILSESYHCVFYIPGKLEFSTASNIAEKFLELAICCKTFNNCVLLHNHVCVVDGVALVGAVCDYGESTLIEENHSTMDYLYLNNSIERLQKHKDVRNIVGITNRIPITDLIFTNHSDDMQILDFKTIFKSDTEKKITHWVYGNSGDSCIQTIGDITYITNCKSDSPYYPLRLLV